VFFSEVVIFAEKSAAEKSLPSSNTTGDLPAINGDCHDFSSMFLQNGGSIEFTALSSFGGDERP
jgi:hypothetical protein